MRKVVQNDKRYKKICKVPNKNGSSNLGGIASDGKNFYAIKTDQMDRVSTIYLPNKSAMKKVIPWKTQMITGLMGHGNGLTWSGGSLLVAPHDYYAIKLSVPGMKMTRIKSPVRVSGIAYLTGKTYIIRTGSKLYLAELTIEMGEAVFSIDKTIKYKNSMADDGFTVYQDIGFHDGKIGVILSHKSKRKNCILFVDLSGEVDEVLLSRTYPSLHEWESVAWIGDSMYIAANTSQGDFIFST
jgi:hypothetical protein